MLTQTNSIVSKIKEDLKSRGNECKIWNLTFNDLSFMVLFVNIGIAAKFYVT